MMYKNSHPCKGTGGVSRGTTLFDRTLAVHFEANSLAECAVFEFT